MKRAAIVAVALTIAAAAGLVIAPSSYAFAVIVEAPQNGAIVDVPQGGIAWVRFTILFRVGGCSHEGGIVGTRFGNVQFSPVRGGGRSFFELLLRPSHKLVEQPPPMPYTEAGFTVVGDAVISSANVSNGEVLRWKVTGLCHVDVGPQGGELAATASGTLRIRLGGGGTGSGTTTVAKPTAVPFRITRIDSPASVRENGARGTATIHWSGNPTFPVTMHDAPASCPGGLTCSSETTVATHRANPLAWKVWWCSGNVASDWKLDFWLWLTDAKGEQTQRVRKQVICHVG